MRGITPNMDTAHAVLCKPYYSDSTKTVNICSGMFSVLSLDFTEPSIHIQNEDKLLRYAEVSEETTTELYFCYTKT